MTLRLTDLQLLTAPWNDDCESGSLQIYEGEGASGPPRLNLCGTTVPAPITSEGNALTLLVTSMYGISESKFGAMYSVLNTGMFNNRIFNEKLFNHGTQIIFEK